MEETISFEAEIKIIGINPFVFIPDAQLKQLFISAGRDRGKIPLHIKIDGHSFTQTLVKYNGDWRLYLNTPMRKAAGKDVADVATFEIKFNPQETKLQMHPKLINALKDNTEAKLVFDNLAPYLQKEIIRYINNLKT